MVIALLASACGGTSDDATNDGTGESTDETAEVETEEEDSAEVEEAEPEAEEVEAEDEEPEPEAEEDPSETEGTEEITEETEEIEEEPVGDEADDAADDVADNFEVAPEFAEICAASDALEAELTAGNDPFGGTDVISQAYSEFIELSPDPQLAEDFELLSEVTARFTEILNDPDVDIFDPNSPAVAEFEALTTPEVESASVRVEEFFAENCGTSNGGGGPQEVDETVSLDGPGETTASLEPGTFDVYEIEVAEGTLLTVTMADPTGFGPDTLLTIITPDGTELTNDDVSGDDIGDLSTFDSRLIIEEAVGGSYSIEARSFQGNGQGEYVLTVTFE